MAKTEQLFAYEVGKIVLEKGVKNEGFRTYPMELKPHFLRETDGDTFLVPSERVEEFDILVTQIEDEEEDEITHELNAKFDDSFGEYRVEGNLYSTPLFLTNHPSNHG